MSMRKLTPEQKEANRLERNKQKELLKIQEEKTQRHVDKITITIEWKKSRMWGNNPACEAEVKFKDGGFDRSPTFRASGCGYDKESTVIADVFNHYLKYKLWGISYSGNRDHFPYGISGNGKDYVYFSGGIGTNCYYKISEFIGGKFRRIASGKTFDVYEYTDNTDAKTLNDEHNETEL